MDLKMRHRLLDVYFCPFSVQQESLKSWLISREGFTSVWKKESLHRLADWVHWLRPQFLVVVFVSIFPCLCLYHFLGFVFVGIFPCLCLYRFLGFVSVIRLSSRRPYPLQRRKQRHSYHKQFFNRTPQLTLENSFFVPEAPEKLAKRLDEKQEW